MAAIPYVCLYLDYKEPFSEYSPEQVGNLVLAMISYCETGASPDFHGEERFIWPLIKSKIDKDAAAYEAKCSKNRVNARKRWDAMASDGCQPELNQNQTRTKLELNQNQSVNQNASGQGSTAAFSPPSVKDIEGYCQSQGFTIDAERFVNYYTGRGWLLGNVPMADWKAVVNLWHKKDLTDHSKEANNEQDDYSAFDYGTTL